MRKPQWVAGSGAQYGSFASGSCGRGAAHVRLHCGEVRPDLTTRETEAEAVAYLLCAQLGLPDTDLSVEYIRAYRGTPDTLDASLERIRSTAADLADAIGSISFTAPSILA